ncbi:MAG: hypothetical protein IPH50_03545 [Rhodanobacteraceae bacterium]|nr:hypothetical protein [Rhodanobacteraceae bacterium]
MEVGAAVSQCGGAVGVATFDANGVVDDEGAGNIVDAEIVTAANAHCIAMVHRRKRELWRGVCAAGPDAKNGGFGRGAEQEQHRESEGTDGEVHGRTPLKTGLNRKRRAIWLRSCNILNHQLFLIDSWWCTRAR